MKKGRSLRLRPFALFDRSRRRRSARYLPPARRLPPAAAGDARGLPAISSSSNWILQDDPTSAVSGGMMADTRKRLLATVSGKM
jgi:hypothetical protein